MTKDQLLKEITKTLTKNKVEKLATLANTAFSITDLVDLTFHARPEIAFRASWILEHTLVKHPQRFIEHLGYFLNKYPQQKNQSCQRHYTKIMMYLTDCQPSRKENSFATILAVCDCIPVVETTFEWLISPKTPVAVQANCIDILFSFKNRYSWIAEELRFQVEFLLRNGGPAIQSRGKKLLKKLSALSNQP